MDFLQPTSWQEALDLRAERPDAVPIAGRHRRHGRHQLRPAPARCAARPRPRARSCGSGAIDDGSRPAGRRRPLHPDRRRPGRRSCPGWRWPRGRSAPRRSASAAPSGGNLGSASPAGDAHPPLLAAEAVVEVASAARGARQIPAAEFYTGVKRNALEPDELIAAVLIPSAAGPQQFCKIGTRNAMVIAVSAFACALHPDRRAVGTGIGSAAPTPRRATEAEDVPRRRAGGRRALGVPRRAARDPRPRLRRARRGRGVPHRRRPRQRRLPAALAVGDGAARRHLGLERPAEGGLTCASPPRSTAPSRRSTTSGPARACSTCCASGWACPARRTPASRASAARAPSTWTASRSAPAWSPPARRSAAR